MGNSRFTVKPGFATGIMLLPNKEEITYRRALEQLLLAIRVNLPTFVSTITIGIDFELAEVNSFREIFLTAEIHDCYFHFQCIQRALKCGIAWSVMVCK